MNKVQKIKLIKFKAYYLYLVSELLDNALFFKKDYKDVCFIDSGIFSKHIYKMLSKQFKNLHIINIKDLNTIAPKSYDLIIAPLSLQYFRNLKVDFLYLNNALKPEGIVLANGYNVLQSDSSIINFKNLLNQLSLKPSLINFFNLGDLVNEFKFKEKVLDRENIIIENNKVELINLYCQTNPKIDANNAVKVLIS